MHLRNTTTIARMQRNRKSPPFDTVIISSGSWDVFVGIHHINQPPFYNIYVDDVPLPEQLFFFYTSTKSYN